MILLPLHVLAGLTALTSGAVALFTPKGGRLHRRSGIVFVYAMLAMSASGAVMAALMPERISVVAGMLTLYLVITALLTVRHPLGRFHWTSVAAMIFALVTGLLAVTFGIQGLSATGNESGIAPMGFIFGAVALLAAFGDARMLIAKSIPWSQRIARHLWRMCFALWIAAASFFLGQADEFPEALRIMPLLCTPVLLVMLLMFFWLVRVLFMQWRPRV